MKIGIPKERRGDERRVAASPDTVKRYKALGLEPVVEAGAGTGAAVSDEAFAAAGRDAFGRVDAIVNNAGIMPLSPLAALKVEEWDRMIDVNVKGVLYGIAAVLPEMTARGSGHVINIASIGALAVSPTAAVYCATKFAVRAVSDGLRQERRDIRVTCIHPGVVESELASTITDRDAADLMEGYRSIALTPDAIGRAVRFALEQPDDVDVSEIVVRPLRSAH